MGLPDWEKQKIKEAKKIMTSFTATPKTLKKSEEYRKKKYGY